MTSMFKPTKHYNRVSVKNEFGKLTHVFLEVKMLK